MDITVNNNQSHNNKYRQNASFCEQNSFHSFKSAINLLNVCIYATLMRHTLQQHIGADCKTSEPFAKLFSRKPVAHWANAAKLLLIYQQIADLSIVESVLPYSLHCGMTWWAGSSVVLQDALISICCAVLIIKHNILCFCLETLETSC
jgi:hypothetical protein